MATVLVIRARPVGTGVVVFGGALVGRLVHDEMPRRTPPVAPGRWGGAAEEGGDATRARREIG